MRKTIYVAIAIWIVSLLLAVPDLVFSSVKYHSSSANESIPFCDAFYVDEDWDNSAYSFQNSTQISWRKWHQQFRTMFRFILLFACPLLVITAFYSVIAFSLLRRSRDTFQAVGGGDAAQRHLDSRKKV